MIGFTCKKPAIIMMVMLGSALILSYVAAAAQNSSNDLSHNVRFELGKTDLQNGDSITIDEVLGTSDILAEGNMYEVKGTYKLASQDKALLAAFVTTEGPRSSKSDAILRTQKMAVDKGEGHFTLLFYMWENGNPHVSFYPVPGGNSFASVYFRAGK
jgi:hypothetical protein